MADPKPMSGMAFTPRKEEWQAVVDVLESGEYDDAQSMAKAVVKTVTKMLWHRDWYAGVHVWETGKGGNFGPFSGEGDAVKFGKSLGVGTEFRVVKLSSPAHIIGLQVGAPGVKGFCQICGHSPFEHGIDGSSRGKCMLSDCSCEKWKEIK